MQTSTRKNWILVLFLGIFAVCSIVLVVNAVAVVRRGLILKQTHNDLKWIGMALHQYHDTHGHFPPVVVHNSNGKALHSWRSVIQSHLGDIATTDDDFRSYDLSEPWNSEINQQSVSRHRFGKHPYQFLAVVGPRAAWSTEGTRKIEAFSDGPGNTALVIAARNTGVRWHEPVDAVVTESGALSVNGRPLDVSSDVFVLTADGAVRYADNGLNGDTLSALITIDAGDKVGEW